MVFSVQFVYFRICCVKAIKTYLPAPKHFDTVKLYLDDKIGYQARLSTFFDKVYYIEE